MTRTANGRHRRAGILAIAALLALGAGGSDVDFERYRALLEKMPAEEYERVKSNYQRFAALDSGKQERLRKLHADLHALGTDLPSLERTLTQYMLWLDTLSPERRRRLEQIDDPHERLNKVRELIHEQNGELLKHLQPAIDEGRKDPGRESRRGWFAPYGRTMEAVKKVEPELLAKLIAEEKTKLDSIPPNERSPWLIAFAIKYGLLELNRDFEWFYGRFSELLGRGRGISELKTEDRRTLARLFAAAMVLPAVEESKLYDFLDKSQKPGIEFFRYSPRSRSHAFPRQLLSIQYYLDNPDELAPEHREKIKQLLAERSAAPHSPRESEARRKEAPVERPPPPPPGGAPPDSERKPPSEKRRGGDKPSPKSRRP